MDTTNDAPPTDTPTLRMSTEWNDKHRAYFGVFSVGEDYAQTLNHKRMQLHAAAFLKAAAQAEYMQAVYRQLIDLGDGWPGTHEQLLDVVKIACARKPEPAETAALGPVQLSPALDRQTTPCVLVGLHGDTIGVFTAEQARTHALWVLELGGAVDMDTQYARFLTGKDMGFDLHQAREAVHRLHGFRDKPLERSTDARGPFRP